MWSMAGRVKLTVKPAFSLPRCTSVMQTENLGESWAYNTGQQPTVPFLFIQLKNMPQQIAWQIAIKNSTGVGFKCDLFAQNSRFNELILYRYLIPHPPLILHKWKENGDREGENQSLPSDHSRETTGGKGNPLRLTFTKIPLFAISSCYLCKRRHGWVGGLGCVSAINNEKGSANILAEQLGLQ